MKNKIGILGYVLATAIAPLIIFGKKIILENDSKRAMTYITYDGYQVDFVSYYKSVILIAGAIILMLSMAGKIDLKKELSLIHI